MRKGQKWREEDDGRTIADMSGISGPSILGARQPEGKMQRCEEQQESHWEVPPLRGRARWMFVLGALKASLLIGLAFLGGLGLLIFLLLQIWT